MSAVVDAINGATGDPDVRKAMLMGALLEGGRLDGPFPVGDGGTSFGPFQIHLPAHPGVTSAQANDASFAAHFMAPSYAAGVNQAGRPIDSAYKAALAAFYAERPSQMYPPSRYNANWPTVLSGGLGGPGPDIGGGGVSPAGLSLNPGDWIVPIERSLMNFGNYLFMGACIAIGGAVILVGLIMLVQNTTVGTNAAEAGAAFGHAARTVVSPVGKARAVGKARRARKATTNTPKASRAPKVTDEVAAKRREKAGNVGKQETGSDVA